MNALRWIGLGIDYVSLRENKINTTQYNTIQPNTMQPNTNALSRSIAIMDVREKIEKKQDNHGNNSNSNQEPHEIRDPHGILVLLRTYGLLRSRL
jgi:hypothetical protein